MATVPKETVEARLDELRQIARDLKIARVYQYQLAAKQTELIHEIRSLVQKNGQLPSYRMIGEAAGVSPQRIQQIMVETDK